MCEVKQFADFEHGILLLSGLSDWAIESSGHEEIKSVILNAASPDGLISQILKQIPA
jgi:hypothetical protein